MLRISAFILFGSPGLVYAGVAVWYCLLIALGCTLVSDNEREFSRIDELTRENWLR